MIVVVRKRSGANTMSVCDSVRKAVSDYGRFMPQDVKMVNVMDTSDFIRQSLRNGDGDAAGAAFS